MQVKGDDGSEFPFPLGRGLSQAKVCVETGKIERVVDIAEAPWRIIGVALLPLIQFGQVLLAGVTAPKLAADAAAADSQAAAAEAPQPQAFNADAIAALFQARAFADPEPDPPTLGFKRSVHPTLPHPTPR